MGRATRVALTVVLVAVAAIVLVAPAPPGRSAQSRCGDPERRPW
ncbi:MAG TPA: hypothetical protein VHG70_17930 [Nocardioidaceae bacterium]|nr:hypothetical protein [Nocardioidaceae bacterium]